MIAGREPSMKHGSAQKLWSNVKSWSAPRAGSGLLGLNPALFLVAGALVAVLPRAEEKLAFRSVEGRALEKTFVQHSSMDLTEMKVSIEGPDGSHDPEIELPKLTIVDDETIEFTDLTAAAGDGKPKKLKRSFTKIENSNTFSGGGEDEEGGSEERKNVSPLADKTVVFTWDADAEEFSAAWDEDQEGDDDVLEALVEDADFRAWLPKKDVAEGDTWEIDTSEFNNLQEPSGPMAYRPEDAPEDYDSGDDPDDMRKNVKGDFKATFKGLREEDGVQVGVIAFEAELETNSERELEQEEGPSITSTLANQVKLEGELLWDVKGGHFHALSCDSDFKLQSSQKRVIEVPQGSFTIEERRGFEGKKTYRFTCGEKK